MAQASLLEHLDHAKPGKFHFLLMFLTGSCWMIGAYGVTIVGFILPAVKDEWQVSSTMLGLLASLGMAGMMIGSIIAGMLSDHFGRRKVLTTGLLLLGVFFLVSALSPTFISLLVLRFLTGMGLGVILPVSSVYVMEFSPTRWRGGMSVVLNACWGLGGTISALVGYSLVLSQGWRPAMLLGVVSFLIAFLVFRFLPESLRFLITKGRQSQIRSAVDRINFMSDTVDMNMDTDPNTHPEKSKNQPGIWSAQYARITASLWILWTSLNFLYQGAYIWLPSLLATVKVSEGRSYILTMLISLGQLPGTFIVAYLADRMSRKKLIGVSLLLLAAGAFLFGLNQQDTWILVCGFFLMVFNGMCWGIAYPFSSEMYPTRMRGAATGWATGIGRMGGVAAPLLIGWVVQSGGSIGMVFSILAATPLLSAIIVSAIPLETTGRSLEEISL